MLIDYNSQYTSNKQNNDNELISVRLKVQYTWTIIFYFNFIFFLNNEETCNCSHMMYHILSYYRFKHYKKD